MSPLRLKNVLAILLFVFFVSTLAAQITGRSMKQKPIVKLSDNISKYPFLWNRQLNSAEGNVFLRNRDWTTYWNNIFLSHATTPSPANNGITQDQGPSVNNITSITGDTDSVPFLAHNTNPFPQPLSDAEKSTATPFINPGGNVWGRTFGDSNRYENPRRKSDIMCEEYGRQISDTISVLPLVSTPTVVTISTGTCSEANHLVIGGVTATPGEFPHQVSLGKFTEGTYKNLCGGTLIAPQWVLTAAHCTYHPSPTHVRIGVHDLRDAQRGISRKVIKMIRHPGYTPPSMYDDIAVVKLNEVIGFNKNVRPACLYLRYDTAPLHAWVSGWGVTEFGDEEGSDTLQKAELTIFDNIKCALRHKQSIQIPNGITPDMVCAGDLDGGWNKDSCLGDSGGPLQIVHPDNKCLFQVFGITSFGQGCAFANMPGVYTKVSHYLDWIEGIVWP